MGIAIAISAVATTNTSSTRTAPTADAVCCAKVTMLRFTPLSISSMHISITSTLRRTITPSRPSAKSAADVARSICTLSTTPPSGFENRQRRDDRGDEQHGHQFEVQPVIVEERDREALQAERRRTSHRSGRGWRLPYRVGEDGDEDRPRGHPWNDQRREAPHQRPVAHIEQHDRVDHEHHHGADVDEDLEHRDDV